MAKLGDLVVRIGADTRDLNKQLGDVRRNMRSMTSNLTSLGQSMTKAITLPLAGLGAMAVKSAADLEQLETSFVSLTGGVEEAAAMMEQLNEFTAKTPFQIENVANAARQLIASGTEISQVNEQLQFLGDIAATSGVTIEEIAAIFAKVNAKGKVELENLNQLAERGIPIFKALAEATGLPADKLGAGAVSVEEFNKVLKSFAEEGGFAAGAMERLSQTAAGKFSTALDNLKQAGAEIGNQLLPFISALLDKVTELAQSFAALSDGTKRAILVLGGMAAALGPLLYTLPQVIEQFKLLSVVISSNPIIAAAGVITAIGTALKLMKTDADSARVSIEKLKQSFSELTEESRVQKRAEKAATLEMLIRYRELSDQIFQAEQAAWNSVKGVENQMRATRKAREDILSGLSDTDKAVLENGRAFIKASGLIMSHGQAQDYLLDNIIDLQNEMAALTEQEVIAGDTTEMLGNSATKAADKFKIFKSEVSWLLLRLENTKTEVFGLLSALEAVEVTSTSFTSKLLLGLERMSSEAKKVGLVFENMGDVLSNAIGNAVVQAETMRQALVEAAKAVIIAALAQAKAQVIARAAEGSAGTGPAYPFVMAGLLTAGMALINSVQIPALAEGGLAYGATTAIVGDNPNARVDPEVIAPLSKLQDIMGASRVEVFGRISGSDIVLANDRGTRNRNRVI
jgi:tape measure domain-containing protein